nr:spermatogenesis-associated protein 31E1-like [Microcebus murinus]
MQAWALVNWPKGNVQGSAALGQQGNSKKMENYPFPLSSASDTWLNPSSTSWMIDLILGILCGLGLFLLLLPCLGSNPSSPPAGQKRKIRKDPVEKRRRPRSRKKGCPLKVCRDCLRELEGARDLILLLQSHLEKLCEKRSFYQLSCADPPGKVCKPAPARAHRPPGECAEDASPATLSPLASLAPLAQRPSPLASTLPVQPQEDQSDLMRIPPGTIPESSPPGYSCSVPPVLATLGLERTILFLSWWWAAAKALFFPTSPHSKSQKEPLFHHPPEAWFWGDPTHRQIEDGGSVFLKPGVRKLLEILITKRAGLKLWKDKEKERSFLKQVSPDYSQGSLGNVVNSPSWEWDTTTPHPFGDMKDKPEQLPAPQQLSHPAMGDHLQQKCRQLFWGLPSLHSESLVAAAWVSRRPSTKPPRRSVSFNIVPDYFPVEDWSEEPSQPPQDQPDYEPLDYEPQPLPQTWPKPQPQPLPQTWPKPHPQPLPQTWPKPQPQPLPQTWPKPQPQPLPQTWPEPQPQPQPLPQTWPEPQPLPQTWPEPQPQPQPLPQTWPEPQPQPPPLDEIHTEVPPSPAPPDVPYCSPPESKGDPTGSCRTTCPVSQEKAQFIPTESDHLEWPLQKRLRWKKMLSSLLKNSRAACSQPDLPQDGQDTQSHKSASVLPGDSIHPEHQEPPKQHIQRSFIPSKDQLGPPSKSQVPGEPMQPQGEFPGRGQTGAEDKYGAFAGESSKGEQKMGSRHSDRFSQASSLSVKEDKDPYRNLWQDLKGFPEEPYIDLRNTLVKVLEDKKEEEESDIDWIRLQRYKSGNYLSRGPKKQQVEKTLNFQLDQKLGDINKGMVPDQSRITTSRVIPKSDTYRKPRNLASLRAQKYPVNTSQELFFLDPGTQQMLEAHIIRFRVRHRWGSNLQSLERINLQAQSPPFPLPNLPSWATGEFGDDSMDEFANLLGGHPWKRPGQKVITKKSVLTLTGFLSAPSPVSEEVQRDLKGEQAGDNRGHSEASPTRQEGRWPSQPLTCSMVSRTWESSTVLGARRGSQEPSASLAMARHDPREEVEGMASGVPCSSIAMLGLSVGSQSSRAEKTMEPVEGREEKPPAWEVILGASVTADSQTINMNLGSGSLGTSESSPFSRMSGTQDPGELRLKTKVVSKFSFKVEVESEDQLQGPATGVLLQDCATGLHVRGRHTDILPTADMSVSQEPQSSSQTPLSGTQSVPSKDASTSQGLHDPTWHGGSSQGQQEPRSPKVRGSWKTQSNMLGPTDKRESCRRPKPREHEPRSAGPRPFQSSGMSHPAQVREREILGNKYSQFPQEKGQAPPESHFGKRINRFLQHLKLSKKGKEQEDSLQKGKPVPATAQSPGPATRSPMNSRAPEVRAVITLVGQILVEKLGLRQGHGPPPEFAFHKQEPRAPMDGRFYYPKGPCHPGSRRVMRDVASSHATPMGHSYLVKNKWVRGKDSNWASPPREPVLPASPWQRGPRVARASGHLHR